MKSALVHDWLPLIGGAEKVLHKIHEIYPSPIYTLIHNQEKTKNTFLDNLEIHTSLIQDIPFGVKKYRSLLPIMPFAVEQFDLTEYELIISSSHAVAKGALTSNNQLHVCYCHSPARYAWDLYQQYLKEANLTKGVKGMLAKYFLHRFRIWDITSANRVDHFIANSEYIARRINKVYRRDAKVIYPPVDVNKYTIEANKDDYYLTASRLVQYKKIDLIAEAFSNMPDKKLVIIGDGPEMERVKAKAGKNIEILGYQPDTVLKQMMQKAKAFVFAAEEDFGIIPVEAQACGTPVIGLAKGGLRETVINGETGIFFNEQTVKDIIDAVNTFENSSAKFDPYAINKHAQKFSEERFKLEFKNTIEEYKTDFKNR